MVNKLPTRACKRLILFFSFVMTPNGFTHWLYRCNKLVEIFLQLRATTVFLPCLISTGYGRRLDSGQPLVCDVGNSQLNAATLRTTCTRVKGFECHSGLNRLSLRQAAAADDNARMRWR